MRMPSRSEGWFFGVVVALVGIYFVIAGVLSGGPDLVGGIVFGVVFLLAAVVILWRRQSRQE
jgi:hypothetical protein